MQDTALSSREFGLAGVVGYPVGQSRSPLIHNHWIAQYARKGAYLPLPVDPSNPQNLHDAVAGMRAMGFAGCNLTMPHKIAALPLCDTLDLTAQSVGAVNVLVLEKDGRLKGMNTDGFGWTAALLEAYPDWRADAGPAVVLGAGGAARAVILALMDKGASEIRIVNRTLDRSEAIIRDFSPLNLALGRATNPCHLEPVVWPARNEALAGASVVVNCTNQGMYDQAPLALDLYALPLCAWVCDLIYVPLQTPLLVAAKARGHRTLGGLGMLLHQARPAFEAWFGVMPEVTPALWEKVLATF